MSVVAVFPLAPLARLQLRQIFEAVQAGFPSPLACVRLDTNHSQNATSVVWAMAYSLWGAGMNQRDLERRGTRRGPT